jgi:hypothetical protein
MGKSEENRDEVLRRMLKTPPQKRVPKKLEKDPLGHQEEKAGEKPPNERLQDR